MTGLPVPAGETGLYANSDRFNIGSALAGRSTLDHEDE